MVSPEGRGHAPRTRTPERLTAPPCFGKTAGTGTAGSVEKRGKDRRERAFQEDTRKLAVHVSFAAPALSLGHKIFCVFYLTVSVFSWARPSH